MNTTTPVNVQPMPLQPVAPGQVALQGEPFTIYGNIAAGLTIASAATIGSNLVDVKNGTMTLPQALANGVIKGAAVSYILARTSRSTTTEVLLAAGILAGAGYFIDTQMKKYQEKKAALGESGEC